MRKILLTLSALIVTASLQAITIAWSLPDSTPPPPEADATSWWVNKLVSKGEDGSTQLGLYLVYAESAESLSAEAVWSTVNGKSSHSASVLSMSIDSDGNAASTWTTWDNGLSTIHTGVKSYYTLDSGDSSATFSATINNNETPTAPTQESGLNGYYYLVVFDPTTLNGDAQYAVAGALQYTGEAASDKANGIYQTTVDVDSEGKPLEPNIGDFKDVSWIGGHWAAVPEPTALALLALGVAGLALRRKI